MSYVVSFTPEAVNRLDAIEQYIAQVASPVTAARYVDAIVAFCENLAIFPLRGAKRDDLIAGLRITNFRGSAVIAYWVCETAERVTILGVFYGGQNYEAILQDHALP